MSEQCNDCKRRFILKPKTSISRPVHFNLGPRPNIRPRRINYFPKYGGNGYQSWGMSVGRKYRNIVRRIALDSRNQRSVGVGPNQDVPCTPNNAKIAKKMIACQHISTRSRNINATGRRLAFEVPMTRRRNFCTICRCAYPLNPKIDAKTQTNQNEMQSSNYRNVDAINFSGFRRSIPQRMIIPRRNNVGSNQLGKPVLKSILKNKGSRRITSGRSNDGKEKPILKGILKRPPTGGK